MKIELNKLDFIDLLCEFVKDIDLPEECFPMEFERFADKVFDEEAMNE